MPWYFHPESDCLFKTEHPLGRESYDACLCEELTEAEAQAMISKGQPVGHTEGTAPDVADQEAFQAQSAIGDPDPGTTLADDKLVKIYVKIREAKSAFVKSHTAALEATYETPLRQIATELKRRLQGRGNDGLKTKHGTVYIAEIMKATISDGQVFHQFIRDREDGLDFLEQRVKVGEVKAYMDKNNGELPPGLSVFRETEARVRKPSE